VKAIRDSADEKTRLWAIFPLVNGFEIGPAETAALLGLLRGDLAPEIVESALWALSHSKEPGVDDAIARFMTEARLAAMRTEALRSLAALATPRATTALEEAVALDAAEEVRAQAATLLGLTSSGDAQTSNTLAQAATSDSSSGVRLAAIESLGASRTENARSGLALVAARGVEPAERARAAEILETQHAISAAGGSDLKAMFADEPDPLTGTSSVTQN
jgi:hypothetical protein